MTKGVFQSVLAAMLLILIVMGCGGSKTVADPKKRDEAAVINLQLGMDYFRQGNLVQAKEKIDRALEQDPRNATAQATAGLLYDRLGETEKAEDHLERAVSLDPKNPDLHNNFAAFLCRNKKYQRGEKQALQASAAPLYQTPEAALLNAGYCARDGGNLERAEQHFRAALAIQPRFGPALYALADLKYVSKEYISARAFIERYMVAQDPPGAGPLWLAVRVERALGNLAMAGDYARKLTQTYPDAPETKQFLETTTSSTR